MKKATKTKNGLDVKTFNNEWSAIQEDLKTLAQEQVSADIDLVDATRALKDAQVWVSKATARKTTAEKRLTSIRGNLGGK